MISFAVAFVLLAAVDQKQPTLGTNVIKSFSIMTPVTGSHDALALLELQLNGVTREALIIELVSSNQAIAAVPLTVRPPQGTTSVPLTVKTGPVASPADVTITAKLGNSTKTATLQVLPPKLGGVGCDQPANVIPAKPLNCTVWLDGMAAEDIVVGLSTSVSAALAPHNVTVRRRRSKEAFQINAEPIAQSAAVQLSAAYAGVTKSVPITVLPVALESLSIAPDSVLGACCGPGPRLTLVLTAAPPSAGLPVKLSAKVTASHGESLPVQLPDSVTVKNTKEFYLSFNTLPVGSTTWVTVTARSDFFNDSDVKTATLKVMPAMLKTALFNHQAFSNVPLGGQQAIVTVVLTGLPPENGAPVDLQYGGDTQVTGPVRVVIPKNKFDAPASVTISPCSVQTLCTVTVTARYLGSTVKASATVHQ
jgi:hypothetical protein